MILLPPETPLSAGHSCLAVMAASAEPTPTACVSVPSWDVPWLLMLLLTAGQGVTIIALSIVLWRRRGQGSRDRGESFP